MLSELYLRQEMGKALARTAVFQQVAALYSPLLGILGGLCGKASF